MGVVRKGAIGLLTVVIFLSILSGPLVAAIDLTPSSQDYSTFGNGTASLSVQSFDSDAVVLRKGEYGSGAYLLEVPDIVVNIQEVQGSPFIVYKIRVPELGYTRSSVSVLNPEMNGTMHISLATDEIAPDRVTQSAYQAEIILLVRSGHEERVLFRESVSLRVIGNE